MIVIFQKANFLLNFSDTNSHVHITGMAREMMTNHLKESCLFVGVGDDEHGKIYKARKNKEREEDATYVRFLSTHKLILR